MKKLAVFVLFLALLGVAVYGYVTAPQTVNQVELEIEKETGNWKPKISQFVFTLVKPGERLELEELEYLKEKLESLPWVDRCSVSLLNGVLRIKVWEVTPAFAIFFAGSTYIMSNKGFVLDKVAGFKNFSPIYYYKGKTSPFTVDGEFVKIKNIIRTEIELAKKRLGAFSGFQEKPEIVLTDTGVNLIFKKQKVIVYLDNSENAWSNFVKFDRLANRLPAGVYDFRFFDMLVRGRNEKCLNRKS
ncbi:hypothetical protein [Phorcysia thermohydrogeniphila]|uniref:Cell division protein FtsQ n=1 Tax=Phorcysia thermohydrogeniphila TaxID=936138 RepID=A0A4R1GDS2_9BACT|nr:hypothetical protein [Phorcysia thermohydrogeniphila]TCK06254.1 hypothetical protein CLV27_0055 [Phorcysia thermohydrogeniphila]